MDNYKSSFYLDLFTRLFKQLVLITVQVCHVFKEIVIFLSHIFNVELGCTRQWKMTVWVNCLLDIIKSFDYRPGDILIKYFVFVKHLTERGSAVPSPIQSGPH